MKQDFSKASRSGDQLLDKEREALRRVRELEEKDKEAFLALVDGHFDPVQKENVKRKIFLNHLKDYLNPKVESKTLFGYFNAEGELESTLGLVYWPSMPYATICYMFARQAGQTFRADKVGVAYCLHKCFERGEAVGIKAYYSLQKDRGVLHKSKAWRQCETPLTAKYYSILEYTVEPDEQPQHTIIWELMDMKTWPYRMAVWLTRLKPENEQVTV